MAARNWRMDYFMNDSGDMGCLSGYLTEYICHSIDINNIVYK